VRERTLAPAIKCERGGVDTSIVTGRIFIAIIFSVVVAMSAVGCAKAHRALTVSAVREKLAADGLRTYIEAPADLFSIPQCGRPITAVIAGGEQQHGVASVFLCANDSAARVAHLPAGDAMPGTRVRRGRYFVIVNGDALLRRWLITTLTSSSR
jgi:hypothetical protein